MKKLSNFVQKNQKTLKGIFLIGILTIFMSSNVFAADSISALDTFGDKVLGIITGKWLKALLAVALLIELGLAAWGSSQGEGGIVKKVIRWIMITGLILAATAIVNFVFTLITPENLAMVSNITNLA